MNAEPSYTDRQGLAFGYLRDRARHAHAEGDGVLVNSLCALALSQISELARQARLRVRLRDVKWAYTLPLFWLIDEYMLTAIGQALQIRFAAEEEDEPQRAMLRAYHFLVQQPLARIEEQLRVLSEMDFDLLGQGKQDEDLVFLNHTVELVWFRNPHQGDWAALLDNWTKRSPAWCCHELTTLKARLSLQTRLTLPRPGLKSVSPDEAAKLPEDLRLGALWIYLLNCEGEQLDKLIEQLGSTVLPVSHVARLLLDFHHVNRTLGKYGEPQEVSLTRRRLFTASSPLMVFNELREARLSEDLGDLFRKSRIDQAPTRIQTFRLAMLCEISALRLWDLGAWQEAIKAQSEAELEAAKWEVSGSGAAAQGMLKAVQSMSYKSQKDDALMRIALGHLEFADEGILSQLVDGLTAVYPRQEYGALQAFDDLSDLVPPRHWVAITKWGLRFAEHMQQRKTLGWTMSPFSYLTQIVRYADPASEIWELLTPEILKIAGNPMLWRFESGDVLRGWLANAPISSARRLGLAMMSVETVDQDARGARLSMLRDAENRSELRNAFGPELRGMATSPMEKILLVEAPDPEQQREAKRTIKEIIDGFSKQAVPAPDSRSWTMASLPAMPFDLIKWDDEDLPLLSQMITAVENPSVIRWYLPQLLQCIQCLLFAAPESFASYLLPRFKDWLQSPPIGQERPVGDNGPFSSMRFNFDSSGEISSMLGWIGFQLLRKLGDPVAEPIANWIQKSVLNPDPRAIPIMIYAGIPAATHLSTGPKTDLLAACQTLLAHLLLRHKREPEYGAHLANAFLYVGQLMRKEGHPLPHWDAEAANEILDLFGPKLSLDLVEGSRSTNADVRAAVAILLLRLQERTALPLPLQSALNKLEVDNRARVRAAAIARRNT